MGVDIFYKIVLKFLKQILNFNSTEDVYSEVNTKLLLRLTLSGPIGRGCFQPPPHTHTAYGFF